MVHSFLYIYRVVNVHPPGKGANLTSLTAMPACGYGECGSLDDAKSLCSRCRITRYCSATCQKLDWKSHRKSCLPCSTADCANSKKKNISAYAGKSRAELANLFSEFVARSNEYRDLKDGNVKSIRYAINAIELEENVLKRFEREPGARVTMIGLLRWVAMGLDVDSPTLAITHAKRAIALASDPMFLSRCKPEWKRNVALDTYDCHVVIGHVYYESREVDLAKPHCLEAFRLTKELYAGAHLRGNEKEYVKGIVAYARWKAISEDVLGCILLLEEAHSCLVSALDEDDEKIQESSNELVEAYINGYQIDKAVVHLEKTRASIKDRQGIPYASATHQLALAMLSSNKLVEAESLEREVIAIYQEHHASFCNYKHNTHLTLAKARMLQLKLDEETEGHFATALQVAKESKPGAVSGEHIVLYDMGLFYELKGDIEKSLECYREGLVFLSRSDRPLVTEGGKPGWIKNMQKKIDDLVAGRPFPRDAQGRPIVMESRTVAPGYVAVRRAL